jgi:sugar O-acyltransferase (sialic acid O-acetyltransferase NeuD family)
MRLVLVCGGGFASDVIGIISALNACGAGIEVAGFVADVDIDGWRFPGYKQIGGIGDMSRLDVSHYLVCLGYPQKKKSVIDRIVGVECCPALIHPMAWIPDGVEFGVGGIVMANACLTRGVTVGKHVYLSHGVLLGHECSVGDYVSAMPGASVSGDTVLGDGCMIGANSTVLEKRRVGKWASVGAGAVVTRDVPDGVTVKGVPAR